MNNLEILCFYRESLFLQTFFTHHATNGLIEPRYNASTYPQCCYEFIQTQNSRSVHIHLVKTLFLNITVYVNALRMQRLFKFREVHFIVTIYVKSMETPVIAQSPEWTITFPEIKEETMYTYVVVVFF